MKKENQPNHHDCMMILVGILRVIGFFSLILFLSPIHVITLPIKRIHPFTMPRFFQRNLVRLLGFTIRVHGVMAQVEPTLFLANHSSYLDIPVLGSLIPAAFVAKAEVAHWPIIGWLAKLQHTVFVERRATRALEQRNSIRDRLEQGQSLILFPEGTSSDGSRTLPFKSSLLSVAELPLPNDRHLVIQPVSIVCTELNGLPIGRTWRPYYAWFGDMTFEKHLWNVFCLGHFTVDVFFHMPMNAADYPNRKALSDACYNAVAQGVQVLLTGRGKSVAVIPTVQ